MCNDDYVFESDEEQEKAERALDRACKRLEKTSSHFRFIFSKKNKQTHYYRTKESAIKACVNILVKAHKVTNRDIIAKNLISVIDFVKRNISLPASEIEILNSIEKRTKKCITIYSFICVVIDIICLVRIVNDINCIISSERFF